MHGFEWVRIDRTLDRTAPIKRLARDTQQTDLHALGLVVRLKLTVANRFPTGLITLTPDDLALELDVPDQQVQALIGTGFLVPADGGLMYAGWQDDQGVAAVLRNRRAVGKAQTTASKDAAYSEPTSGLHVGTRQPTAQLHAHSTVHDMTEQNSTGQKPTPSALTRVQEQDVPMAHAETAGIILRDWPADKRCTPRAVLAAIRQDQAHPDASTCSKIAASARRWRAAYEAQGRTRYLPRVDSWIASGAWREEPPAVEAAPANAVGGLSEREWDNLLGAGAMIDARLRDAATNTEGGN